MERISFAETVSKKTMIHYDARTKSWYGKCPFCKDDSESFKINEEKGIYICYLCGAKGTKADFDKSPVSQEAQPAADDERILSVYQDAAVFYFEELHKEGNPGMKYLRENRGMTDSDTELFGLGYAPEGYNNLYQYLSGKYPEELLLETGLFRKSEKGYTNDFFRNRVMYPIFNKEGLVIAFGGRALSDEAGPKYLNSPESVRFSKRRTLYGYPYQIRKRGKALIICEGYMDCIALKSHGFLDSCAVLGTALTKEHAAIIRKDYSQVILSLDSDQAGVNAAKKSMKILSEAGISVRILDLRPVKDPDEFLRKFPREHLSDRITLSISPDAFLSRYGDLSTLISVLLKQG